MWTSKTNIGTILNIVLMKLYHTDDINIFYSIRGGKIKLLIGKMWGDYWNKFAGLRVFLAFMYTHPGKKSIFMGNEIAQFIEWRFNEGLEWQLLEFETHKKHKAFVKALNTLYIKEKSLWEQDYSKEGFTWVEPNNSEQSIIVYMRKAIDDEFLIVVCNFTSKVFFDYKIGVPKEGTYEEIFNTDKEEFGGSGQVVETDLVAVKEKWHNEAYSLDIKVPPMGATIFKLKS